MFICTELTLYRNFDDPQHKLYTVQILYVYIMENKLI